MELQRSRDGLDALRARLLDAQVSERTRIARELHDDVAQQIAALAIDLRLPGRRENCLQQVDAIYKTLRDLSHRLHPARLQFIGLAESIRSMQRERSSTSSTITFEHDDIPPDLPPALTLCLYRVAQEAVHNAIKHGHAPNIAIALRRAENGFELTIADDGSGFDVAATFGQGLGLISIGEQVETAGGTVDIESSPGSGTRLKVGVPWIGRAAPSLTRARRVIGAGAAADAPDLIDRRVMANGLHAAIANAQRTLH